MIRAIDKWLVPYLRRRRRTLPPGGTLHILLCICDHFEPFHGSEGREEALARVNRWRETFPKRTAPFRDADGTPPAHTFFTPLEQHDDGICRSLAKLCATSHAEVEVHLHHDGDTADGLRAKLTTGKQKLMAHGFLSRTPEGEGRYAFVHGDWALDDSHPEGKHCGVRNELEVLLETGCYADFTMPAAPNPCQTRMVNSIYHATDTPAPKSHDTGTPVRAGGCVGKEGRVARTPESDRLADGKPAERLMMIQGPLGLNWKRRKWGCIPRLENGELSAANPPDASRLLLWLDLHVHVRGRPEWVVVKLHTHGGVRANMDMLLGSGMERFHHALTSSFNDGNRYCLHYLTARELTNIILAAESGRTGCPGKYRDSVLAPPPVSVPSSPV